MMCTWTSTANTEPSCGKETLVLSASLRRKHRRMSSQGIMKLNALPRAAVLPRAPCMLSFMRCPYGSSNW